MREIPDLRIDFVSGPVAHRLRFGGGRGQPLARAIGLTDGKTPTIVDATAGLGRDSFVLASLGAKVIMIERSKKMHSLLEDGLARAHQAGGELREIIDRMTLIYGDAKDLLPQLEVDAVLVDPMHPVRNKSALVKLDLRQVREIVGEDDNALALMNVAIQHVRKRVVLKWPLTAPSIPGLRHYSHQILGKTTRYDVFMKT